MNQTVAAVAETTNPPVPLEESVDLGSGITARILSTESVEGVGRGPGEVGGPAITIRVSVTNSGPVDAPLNDLLMTVEDSQGAPGQSLSGEPASPLTGSLPSEQSEEGVYVFRIPDGAQGPLSVTIRYSAGSPVALFKADIQ